MKTVRLPADEEWFPVVDEQGETIGRATRRACHDGTKRLHPVVHLHVFDAEGRLYLQRRPLHKDIQPGKWDTAVGGHVDYGETVTDALFREAAEELDIADFEPEMIARYVFESEVEKELVHTFRTVYAGKITPHPDELDGGRFWTADEIRASLGNDLFTPNFAYEFGTFLDDE
ncbi:MAG: NUDIX domain-containing protein [Tannerella sp.]|jgi:isopentenyldiphosphate isomerase|nr:NUDIX domain-containing protein [Tannerella sp.]